MANLWKCPKCKREFGKKGQQHSCVVYPLKKHFEGKEKVARPLYNVPSRKKLRRKWGQ